MALQTTEGKVFRVHTKNYRGKDLHSFKIDNEEWYNMGEDRHGEIVQEGYVIKVGWEEDNKGRRIAKKFKLVEKGEPVSNTSGSGGGRNSNSNSGGGGKKNVDYNAAVARAIQMVGLLIEGDALDLPAKTKKKDRETAVARYVDLYTAQFFNDIDGYKAATRASEELEGATSVSDEPQEEWDDTPPADDFADAPQEDWDE